MSSQNTPLPVPPQPPTSSNTIQPQFDYHVKHLSQFATGWSHKQQSLSNYQRATFEPTIYTGNLQHYAQMEREQTFTNRTLPYFRASRHVSRDVLHHSLPSLRDVHYQDRPELFSRKVRLCCYQFSPHELMHNPGPQRDRDLKRQTCQELAQYIHTAKPNLTDDQLAELFEMFEINLFTPLSPTWAEFYDSNNPPEDAVLYLEDHRWDYIQLIYDIVLKLANLTETDQRLLQKYFSPSFVLGLLERFDSEQSRERDYLKTILHRIYGNFMQLRPFIRTAINHVFFRIIYETDRFNGTSELLEILGSIINGFALPLKEQHKVFLMRVLLPMHKITGIGQFLGQLTYCLTQFLEKDATLASHMITAIMTYWPRTSSKKELLFLKELDDLIDKIQAKFLTDQAFASIFDKLGQCIASPHFQIAERALMVLHSEGTFRLLAHNRALALPPIIDGLQLNTHSHIKEQPYLLQFLQEEGPAWNPGLSTRLYGHWSPTISDVCSDVLKKFSDMDQEKCGDVIRNFETRVRMEPNFLLMRKAAWRKIYQRAEATGTLHEYNITEFEDEYRAVNANPPLIVTRDKVAKSNNNF